MKEIKKKFILFDFDGVILDSFDTALGVAIIAIVELAFC
jgi:beta-phosphoglucomutase-like phosphatase (HAD superfamily)